MIKRINVMSTNIFHFSASWIASKIKKKSEKGWKREKILRGREKNEEKKKKRDWVELKLSFRNTRSMMHTCIVRIGVPFVIFLLKLDFASDHNTYSVRCSFDDEVKFKHLSFCSLMPFTQYGYTAYPHKAHRTTDSHQHKWKKKREKIQSFRKLWLFFRFFATQRDLFLNKK